MKAALKIGCAFVALAVIVLLASCKSGTSSGRSHHWIRTLQDYAREAEEHGSREAAVPYAIDEEEGEMLIVRSVEEAFSSYEWVLGEPIEEKILTFSRVTGTVDSPESDSIYTVYRFHIEKRLGKSKDPRQPDDFTAAALKALPLRKDEMLVAKSGGNITVDGVLLKKRGTLCFSELMPRRYLLALWTDTSNQIGWLHMGCRSIYSVDGDGLSPRQQEPNTVTTGIKEHYGNSLQRVSEAIEKLQSR